MYSIKQAKKLFRKNAVLIGNSDAIPYNQAEKLIGEDALQYVLKSGKDIPGVLFNVFGIGDEFGTITYFTEKGFFCAITYRNILDLLAAAEAKQ